MTRIVSRFAGGVAAITLLFSSSAVLAGDFVDVPPLGGASSPSSAPKKGALKMRFVTYDGSTNGQMVVELANTGTTAERFSPEGLYFVPKGDPETAPQRLGAAGPIVIQEGQQERTELNGLVLAPGEKKQVRLEVFCIDSHRSSPNPSTTFDVSPERLPAELRVQISSGAERIIRENAGDVKRSKGAIQSYMWETRDANWVRLRGERKQEKAAPREHHMQQNIDPFDARPRRPYRRPQRQGPPPRR